VGAGFYHKQNRVIISKHCLKRFKHNPKNPLGLKEIWFDIEVIDAINLKRNQIVLHRRHEKLEYRWIKCIELKKDYTEK